MLEDLNNFINMTYGKYFEKTMNKFLIGYSLGSLLCYNTVVNKKDFFDGIIMIAPPIIFEEKLNPFKQFFIKFMMKVFPSFPFLSLNRIIFNIF